MSNALDRFIQLRAHMMRISPFFSTLLLHTTVELSDSVPTMAVTNRQPHPRPAPAKQNPTTASPTTGSDPTASPTTSSTAPGTTASTAASGTARSVILINQEFADTLSDSEFMAVVCHEVLHLAFCHLSRAPECSPKLAAAGGSQVHMYYLNLAADIIVNGIIVESGLFKLPEGAMTEASYAELVGSCSSTDVLQGGTRGLRLWSLPKVYQRVCADAPPVVEVNMCLGTEGAGDSGGEGSSSAAAAEAWEEIVATAKTAELMAGKSSGYMRDLAELEANSEVTDYRSLLAKFVFQSPETWDDAYDRRFIHQGLYIDVPMSDTLDLEILIDSSGSIDTDLLKTFLSELSSNLLLSRWAAIKVRSYFFDTALYAGPASIDEICALKTIPGGGGTDFACWHNRSTNVLGHGGGSKVVLVYTDGYAVNLYDSDFYEDTIGTNVLWVLPAREESNKKLISLVSDIGHQYLHL